MSVFFPSRSGVSASLCRIALPLVASLCLLWAPAASAQTTVPGKIPGEFAVSPSGAATYRIPIQVPPGVSGMEPKLALSYNSQAGNDIMGMGWSIEGLSAITRCPMTMATDGIRGGINHNQNDRFCLDGKRLINVVGTYGASGSEYRTEVDSFSKVSANGAAAGNAANGPESFTIKTKAGLTMEYGATADSRIEAQGKAVVRIWALSQMRDVKGNVLNFSYGEDNPNGEYWIDKITYADGRKISFAYEIRPDKFSGFEVGAKLSRSKRLQYISTLLGNVGIQKIAISYHLFVEQKKSVVSAVSLCSAGAVCSDSLYFGQFPDNSKASMVYPVMDWGYSDRRWWVDVNGDGRPDYCRAVGQNSGSGSYMGCSVSTDVSLGPRVDIQMLEWGFAGMRWWIDFNGDGYTDYCRASGPNKELVCSISSGTGFGGDTMRIPMPDWGYEDRRWWVDMNGDGRLDYCRAVGATSGSASYMACSLSIGTGLSAPLSTQMLEWGYAGRRWWVDFDGDGLLDYCRASGANNDLICSFATDSGLGQIAFRASVQDWGYSDRQWWVDINGDGKQDYCRATGADHGAGSYLTCSPSTGVGLGAPIVSEVRDWGYPDRRWWVDVNDDGLQDYCRATGSSSGAGSYMTCSLTNGAGLDAPVSVAVADWGDVDRRWWVDVNGDGRQDYCVGTGSISSAGGANCITKFARRGAYSIGSVNSGYSVSAPLVYLEYRGLSADGWSSVYQRGSSSYPRVGVQDPRRVVSSVRQRTGVQGFSNETIYSYGILAEEQASAQYPGSGRGMLGFGLMRSREIPTGIERFTEFSQEWPYIGMPTKSEAVLASAGNAGVLNRITTEYFCFQSNTVVGGVSQPACAPEWSAGKVYFPFAKTITEQSWDLDGTALPVFITTQTYLGYADGAGGPIKQFGDPSEVRVDIREGSLLKQRKVFSNQYQPAKTDGSNWELGRLKRATVTVTNGRY